jgi:hypothetical protein
MIVPASKKFCRPMRHLIVMLAARHRLPAVYSFRYFATTGGLISYGANPIDMYRRAANHASNPALFEVPSRYMTRARRTLPRSRAAACGRQALGDAFLHPQIEPPEPISLACLGPRCRTNSLSP